MAKLHYMLLAIAAGVLMPLQAGVNKLLGDNVGGVVPAALVSFFVGTVALAVYIAVGRIPMTLGRAWELSPWWHWVGGAMGAFFVAASIVLVTRLGAAAMLGFILAGQLLASMVLDHFGLLGYPTIPFDLKRLAGAGFLAAGVYLIRS